jgi:protein SCO1/2
MTHKSIWLGIVLGIIVTLTGVYVYYRHETPTFRGQALNAPIPAPEITMTDDEGQPFHLSELRGKVVLLFFGYVNCPDECPLTMAHFKEALDMLGDSSKAIQVVMVSTDPVGDTPQAMKDFLGHFNPDFIGIPGTDSQLKKIWEEYGVTVLEGGETHSSYTYVIDRKGDQRLLFNPDSSPEDIASDLNILLNEN